MSATPSLSELLASVRSNEQYGFAGLPVHSFAAGHAIPLGAATHNYRMDSNDPFGSIPPVNHPRPESSRSSGSSQFSISSSAAVAPELSSSSSSPSSLSQQQGNNSTQQRRRRSQRLASNLRDMAEPPGSTTVTESRKRKSRSTTSTSPKKRAARKKPPPDARDDSEPTEDSKPAATDEEEETTSEGEGGPPVACCICMCEPEKEEVSSINGCEHLFCFECIGKWSDRENTCPLCKSRFTAIARVHKIKKRKGGKQIPNSKRVKQRDQRADVISGPAIEAMLASIAAASNATPGRLGRFLVALGSRRPPTLAASSRRTTVILEDDIFSDETDEDELPMIPFNAYMRNMQSMSRASNGMPSMFNMEFAPMPPSFGGMPPPQMPTQFRTYASNTFEQNAGSPSNPLEIDLDDDDEEVEVFDSR